MKSILIHLEDEEYEKLNKIKGNLSWKEVLLAFLREGDKTSSRFTSKNQETRQAH